MNETMEETKSQTLEEQLNALAQKENRSEAESLALVVLSNQIQELSRF